MKLVVDAKVCAAGGNCVRLAPDLLESDDWGYSSAIGDGLVPAGRESAALAAQSECPTGAITVTDEGAEHE